MELLSPETASERLNALRQRHHEAIRDSTLAPKLARRLGADVSEILRFSVALRELHDRSGLPTRVVYIQMSALFPVDESTVIPASEALPLVEIDKMDGVFPEFTVVPGKGTTIGEAVEVVSMAKELADLQDSLMPMTQGPINADTIPFYDVYG